jgi:hypothetical protein
VLAAAALWHGSRPHLSTFIATPGRDEGCLSCHLQVAGLGASHAPERVGCASCHLGDAAAHDKEAAHRGLLRVPGNVADARLTCGQAGCHLSIAPRIEHSIMTTMAGVISANRRVLGEPIDPAAPPPHPGALTQSVADSHLRELCVSCHLGIAKTDWGPITQESRGGGCNACHLVYSDSAMAELARYRADRRGAAEGTLPPAIHPSFTLNPTNEHCFGCHSRSSRISLGYAGGTSCAASRRPAIRAARANSTMVGISNTSATTSIMRADSTASTATPRPR